MPVTSFRRNLYRRFNLSHVTRHSPMLKNIILALVLALSATFASAAEWRSDYDKALADAKASNKYVLLDFNGSDWCPPCIEMKKVAFSKPAFPDLIVHDDVHRPARTVPVQLR